VKNFDIGKNVEKKVEKTIDDVFFSVKLSFHENMASLCSHMKLTKAVYDGTYLDITDGHSIGI
jgi:hypothetical protein